jgi:hypothetical protein
LIAEHPVKKKLPAALGGTIADGTYWQTGWSDYVGPGGTDDAPGYKDSFTLGIQGAHFEMTLALNEKANVQAFSGGLGYSGTNVDFKKDGSCSSVVPYTYGYTASGDTLHLYTYWNAAQDQGVDVELTRQ